MPSARSRLCLLLAILVAMTVVQPGVASAEGLVDGTYAATLKATKRCQQGDYAYNLRFFVRFEAKVVQSGSNVSFTISGRQAFTGSLDADLNFDVPVNVDNWIGHFTLLSDGGATISGEVVGQCSGVTGPFLRLTGSRTSGGPAPTATPTPTGTPEDEPGNRLAIDTIYGDLCAGQPEDVGRPNCAFAARYGIEFRAAMQADKLALPAGISREAAAALDRLIVTVALAANAAALQEPGPCGEPIPVLSFTDALLEVFAKLFIQGIRQAATQQPADVQATASLADSLLFAAITADKAKPRTSSSCGTGA